MPNILRFYEAGAGTNDFLLTHRDLQRCLLIKGTALQEITERESLAYKKGNFISCHGCLGILPVNATVNGEQKVVELLLLVSHCESVGKLRDAEIFRITDLDVRVLNIPGVSRFDQIPALRQTVLITKGFFTSGRSYFCVNRQNGTSEMAIHLSQQVQSRSLESTDFLKFVWNRGMFHRFKQFDVSDKWTFKVICGGISVRSVNVQGEHAQLCVIYRQSCDRAGTRFLTRGVDENGHVANFVESEIIISCNEKLTSYILTRGSIPLFWDQPGIQVGAHKTRFTREHVFGYSAFLKHMLFMKQQYDKFAIVDLLGTNRGSEDSLSKAYSGVLEKFPVTKSVPYIHFDFHAECPASDQERRRSGFQRLYNLLQNTLLGGVSGFGFFYMDDMGLPNTTRHQLGVYRVNCLDCLDRTNMVQGFIAERVLPSMLSAVFGNQVQAALEKFNLLLPDMIKLCGDEVSKMYAGTGALSADDRTGKIFDAGKSAARTFQNNFFDEAKQQSFDLVRNTLFSEHPVYQKSRMLCNDVDLNIPFKLREYICDNQMLFTEAEKIRVCIGTWNVNGGKQFQKDETKDETDVSLWLFNAPEESLKQFPPVNGFVADGADFNQLPDIYAIGFEEIVDLDLKNMISTSHITADEWHDKLSQLFCPKGYSSVLKGCQLVGVCLFVFVKNKHIPYVKSIGSQTLKTGLKGAAGNKGGVAIRFQLYSTSLCFICSHFAAGQSNFGERNADFHSLASRFKFPPLNQGLNEHDYIFWCGDFNYRIDMENALTRNYIEMCQWPKLLENDQLTLQRSEGNVFEGFVEGPVMFAPTYKYDLLTDEYDSSEKCRTPAWTDRILWKRRPAFFYLPEEYWPKDLHWPAGDLIYYGRAEVKSSDHRPVVAYIDVDMQNTNPVRRRETISNLMMEIGPPNGAIHVKLVDLQAQNWVQLSNDWRIHLEQYLSEYTDGSYVSCSRIVAPDMVQIVFRDGVNAVKAVSLSGHRITNTIEMRVEFATRDYTKSYSSELQRLDEKLNIDIEVADQINLVLQKEQPIPSKTPLISFSPNGMPGSNGFPFEEGSVAIAEAGPAPSTTRQPPPKRPPPPKIPNSQSTGNLSQSQNSYPKPGASFMEQAPLLGLPSNSMGEKAQSFVDVAQSQSSNGSSSKAQILNQHLFVGHVDFDVNSNCSSLVGSVENVNNEIDVVNYPAPPSNCNSCVDLTDPPISSGLFVNTNYTNNNSQQFTSKPKSDHNFETDFSQMSISSAAGNLECSHEKLLDQRGIIESLNGTSSISNQVSVTNSPSHVNNGDSSTNRFQNSTDAKVPPPLPPKSDRQRRPIPFPTLK